MEEFTVDYKEHFNTFRDYILNPDLVIEWDPENTMMDGKQSPIITKMTRVSANVFKACARGSYNPFVRGGGATTAVAHPEVIEKYISAHFFVESSLEEKAEASIVGLEFFGFFLSGRLGSRFDVYSHNECSKDEVIIFNKNYGKLGGIVKIV